MAVYWEQCSYQRHNAGVLFSHLSESEQCRSLQLLTSLIFLLQVLTQRTKNKMRLVFIFFSISISSEGLVIIFTFSWWLQKMHFLSRNLSNCSSSELVPYLIQTMSLWICYAVCKCLWEIAQMAVICKCIAFKVILLKYNSFQMIFTQFPPYWS